MLHRLIAAAGQTRSAKSVEAFGWLILLEGMFVLFAPNFSIAVLGIEPLTSQAANYFRLVGLLVCGLGTLGYDLALRGLLARLASRTPAGSAARV